MTRGRRRLLTALAVATAIAAGLLVALQLAAGVEDDAPPPAAGPRAADYVTFAPSMAGTRPDGAVRAAVDGQLMVNAELAYLFDYYLAGLGERPLDAIRGEILRELGRRLPAAAVGEATRLLDAYLAYKRALADLERQPARRDSAASTAGSGLASLAQGARQRLTAMRQLRRNYFSEEEIAGLFSASDAYDDDAIARVALAADPALSAAERQRQLAALDARLSPAQRADRDAPTSVLRLEQAVSQARAEGADDNEVYRLRSATLSPAAAARLAEVDREDGDWQRRIVAYQAQRQQLLQQPAGADAAVVQQLRDSGFTPEEQKRLPAYE